jgi:DNA-directed RNA polymerase specialized sigma24 family protein
MRPFLDREFERFAKTRDAGALEVVLEGVAQEVLLVALQRCPDAVAAKDLVQEVLLVAIRRADQYQVERPVLLWMLDILDEQVRKSQ